jgi:heat shock protein HslJ
MRVALALAAAVGLGMVGASACSKAGPEGTSPMQSPVGVEWRLVSIGGTPAGAGANGQPATLRLDETSGRASGYAGCNQFSGSYTLSGSSLSFGPLAMTRMACAQGGELESRYTMALGQANGWKMTSTGLELRKGSTLLAKFTK